VLLFHSAQQISDPKSQRTLLRSDWTADVSYRKFSRSSFEIVAAGKDERMPLSRVPWILPRTVSTRDHL